MEQKICIGKIVKTVGIKGEVKVVGYTDSLERFRTLKDFYLDNQPFECEKASIRNDFVVLKIKGYDTPEQAFILKDKLIYVDRTQAVSLKQGQYFICDLVGLKLINETRQEIGYITDVENYGASDIIDCVVNSKEGSVPFIDGIFDEINIEKGYAVVKERFYEVLV